MLAGSIWEQQSQRGDRHRRAQVHRRLHEAVAVGLVIATYLASLWFMALSLKELEISLVYASGPGSGQPRSR
jgi:multidrug transporter EmrE-like cation transporter